MQSKAVAVAAQSNTIGAHGPGDVLDLLVADELQRQAELALEVVVGGARDEHAAGIAKLLQARRDIDPVTEQIVAVDNDVPEIDSDTEDNAAVARHVHLLGGDFLLNGHCAGDSVHHRSKLHDCPVAHQLDDTALIAFEQWIDRLGAQSLESGERCGLVILDKTRIAHDVGGHDRRQASL